MKKIWIEGALSGAILGAIVALVIYGLDVVPYETIWGDVIFRHPTHGIKLADILPKGMLIGALVMTFLIWITKSWKH
jgi:hypothetical protein